ncbi:MAG TPA: hypothetical protein VGS41_04730 [Chthonomonadales bacterium]|nr:hypothetical protein [Chthonomonadales bacterium]
MPLIKSASRAAISENIRTERAAGKPENQAVAIAESTADRARKRKAKRPAKKHWLD